MRGDTAEDREMPMTQERAEEAMRYLSCAVIRLTRGSGSPWDLLDALKEVVRVANSPEVRWDHACRAMRIPGKYLGEDEINDKEIVLAALHVAGEHWRGNTVQAHKGAQALTDALRQRDRELAELRARWRP